LFAMHSGNVQRLINILALLACLPVMAQESLTDLYLNGEYGKAIGIADEAIAAGDSTAGVLYLKALSEVQLGLTVQAIQTLETALNLHPDHSRIRRTLAGLYLQAGDYTRSRDHYVRLVTLDSIDVSAWLKLAEIAWYRQQYEEAVTELEQVLLIDSLNLEGMMTMGEILNRLNNSGAIVYYQRAFRHHPRNQKAAYALANLYIQGKKPHEAIPVCEQILDIDSTNIKFLKLLGYAHYKAGDPSSAIPFFRQANSLGDSTAFSFKFRGICHYLVIEHDQAINSLTLAVKRDSLDAEIHFFLGASLGNTGRKKEAMFHLDQSLHLMQPDPSIVSRIYAEQGNIKRLEGAYEQAYVLYGRAWNADTTDPMALYFMASIMDNSLHRSEEALLDYQRFIDRLDQVPGSASGNDQIPSIRAIVEDRIVSLKEELFFLDRK